MSAGNSPAPAAARPYRPPAPLPRTKPLSKLGFMVALRENPISTWGIWNFENPITTGRTALGPMTGVSSPEGIRHVMVDNVGNYVKDRLQLRVLKPGLGTGLLTAEGESWKAARRTLAPLFAPRTVETFVGTMQAKAGAMVARLQAQPLGARVNISDEMTRVTFEILTDTLFSDAVDGTSQEFGEAFTRYFENQGKISPLDMLNAPDWIPRFNRYRAQPAINFFEEKVRQIIARRRALLATPGAAVPRDILTLLLEAADPETGVGLSEAEVGANIVTFLGAGHETTANALSWTLFLLAKHPAAQSAVAREAREAENLALVDWLDNLPMTRAVIEEAMRLYPPAPTLSRMALAEDEIQGVRVAAGSTVIISPYVVHRHRSLWSEPDYFRPERFLPPARDQIDRYAFIPFGAGPRVCIGQRFAMHEAVIVLATLMRHFGFAMPKGESVMPLQRITLRPSPRLEMLLQRADAAG
ncbi:MAG: cytochrome P450 [Hyphomicrobiales bacterium]|nr:cytochrome P450 [Hyphomicrobiales bacterium]